MSTTEHDLDAAAVDDDADAVDELTDGPDDQLDDGVEVEDDAAHHDPAEDIEVAVEEEDAVAVEDGHDVEERLGSYDAFLAEAQVDHAGDADLSYELPAVIIASDADDDEPVAVDDASVTEADPVEGRAPAADEPVSDDVLEELRRANIDGPTVPLLPHDDSVPTQRRPKRSPEYDPAPMPIPLNLPRILGRKPRVRRVTRVVRHVDPWSVFKIAAIANLLIYVIVLVAGVLLWNVAYATGTVDNVERFFESFGWASFEFNGGEIYHAAWTGGIFLVIGFTGLAVLAATMFNLITDLVGGMRFTVLEEEVVETRSSPMRRFVVRRSEPEIPLVSSDESGQIIREAVVDDSTGYIRPR